MFSVKVNLTEAGFTHPPALSCCRFPLMKPFEIIDIYHPKLIDSQPLD